MKYLTALPVYNEADHLCEVLSEVRKYASDVLVVDDGSSDRTSEVLGRIGGISVLTHEINQGYGAALRTAFCYSIRNGYDYLVTIDCDGQHEPCLIPQLIKRMLESPKNTDIVSGSRYLQKFSDDSAPPEDRRRINMQITALLNREFHFNLTDAFCGFKVYRVESLKQLSITESGYAMPLQLWVQSAKIGFRVVEYPVPLVYLAEERSFGGALDESEHRRAYYIQVIERECEANRIPGQKKMACGSS